MSNKRLTIDIPDDEHYALKVKATSQKRTIKEILTQLIREYLRAE